MAIELNYGQIIVNMVTGTNGPFSLPAPQKTNPTIWYDLGGATSIVVNYSLDGGINWTPIPMTATVGTHYENSLQIVGNLGLIQFVVTGTPNASTLGGIS